MSVTLANLRSQVRQEIRDTASSTFTDSNLNNVINEALRQISRDTRYLRRTKGFVPTANEPRIDFPDGLTPVYVYYAFWRGTPLYLERRENYQYNAQVILGESSSSHPRAIFHNEERREMYLWPRPDATAYNTTLNGAINTTDATITLASLANFPETYGRAIIAAEGGNTEEEIEFHDVNTSTVQLLHCTRAIPTTVASNHSSGATINYAPLVINFAYIHPALSADGDTIYFPDDFRDLITLYATHVGHRQNRRYTEANLYKMLYLQELGQHRSRDMNMGGSGFFENISGGASDLYGDAR